MRDQRRQLSIGFQQHLGAGFFGGDGFRLQKIVGQGKAWCELSGEVLAYDLKPGESLRVHPAHVGLFQDTVQFSITTVKGIKNKIFGGDGIFLALITGPGRVWLQSLPLQKLAQVAVGVLAWSGGRGRRRGCGRRRDYGWDCSGDFRGLNSLR